MIDLKKLRDEYTEDITSVVDWCNEIYKDSFAQYFTEGRELFKRLQSKTHPITDEELTWILMDLPMNLFSVSEMLSNFKISQEVIKMRNRQREKSLIDASLETTMTKKQSEATDKSLEDKLLAIAYSTIIDRVSSEISFARELIMGAKKLWDSRRYTEKVHPVDEIDPLTPPQLPEYKPSYINNNTKGEK